MWSRVAPSRGADLSAEFVLLAGVLRERGRIDRAGVCALLEAGMVIGSHDWSHRDWRRINNAPAWEELEGELLPGPSCGGTAWLASVLDGKPRLIRRAGGSAAGANKRLRG